MFDDRFIGAGLAPLVLIIEAALKGTAVLAWPPCWSWRFGARRRRTGTWYGRARSPGSLPYRGCSPRFPRGACGRRRWPRAGWHWVSARPRRRSNHAPGPSRPRVMPPARARLRLASHRCGPRSSLRRHRPPRRPRLDPRPRLVKGGSKPAGPGSPGPPWRWPSGRSERSRCSPPSWGDTSCFG